VLLLLALQLLIPTHHLLKLQIEQFLIVLSVLETHIFHADFLVPSNSISLKEITIIAVAINEVYSYFAFYRKFVIIIGSTAVCGSWPSSEYSIS
jgi:hypothetical protein